MDHVLTEHGLRLTYMCDANAIDELDQDRILDDLSDDTPDGDPLPWLTRYRLADYDHLVLVTDRSSGRYLAFLAAKDGATTREDFLLLETVFVTSVARGQNLMRRMIALAMLRIGGIRAVPSVIVACTRNPICTGSCGRRHGTSPVLCSFLIPTASRSTFTPPRWRSASREISVPTFASRRQPGRCAAG